MCVLFGLMAISACANSVAESPPDPAMSPLDQFLASPQSPASDSGLERQAEEFIASCMKSQGFEYIPFVSNSGGAETEAGPVFGSLEYATIFGYGITTLGRAMGTPISAISDDADPNLKIFKAMDQGMQREYEIALQGFTSIQSVPDVAPEVPPEPSCRQQAQDKFAPAPTQAAIPDQDQYRDLWDELETLYNTMETDPRLQAQVVIWSTCMQTHGFPDLKSRSEPQNEITIQWATMNGYSAALDPAGRMETSLIGPEPLQPDPEAWEQLKELEIQMATADFQCQGDYEAVWRQVRSDRENQFIVENSALLEQWRNQVNSGG